MYHERHHHSPEMGMVSKGMPSPDANNQVWFKFKTRLCVHYSKSGGCFYGDRCQFAHGKEELRRAVLPVQPPQPQILHPQQLFQQPMGYMHHHLMAQQQQRQRQLRHRNNHIRQPIYKNVHHNAHMKQNKKKSDKYGLKTKSGNITSPKIQKTVHNAQSLAGASNDVAKTPNESTSPKASKQHNNPKFKTELCRSVVQGTSCAFGDKCIFVHKCDDMYEDVKTKAQEMVCLPFICSTRLVFVWFCLVWLLSPYLC